MVTRPNHMPLNTWLLKAGDRIDHGSSHRWHVRRLLAPLLLPHLRLMLCLTLATGLIGKDQV